MKDKFGVVIDLHVLLLRDGRLLWSRRANTGWADGCLHLLAGRVEEGEDVQAAAIREAATEVGVVIRREDLELVHVMHLRRGTEQGRIGLFFLTDRWDGDPCVKEPDRGSELVWTDLAEIPSDTVDYAAAAVRCILAGDLFSQHGWDQTPEAPPSRDAHRAPVSVSDGGFTTVAGVHLVLVRDGKLLWTRRANTGWADGQLHLVAGHLEAEEDLESATIREAAEEIRIAVRRDDLTFVHAMHHRRPDSPAYIALFFRVAAWGGEPVIGEPHLCSQLVWSELSDIPADAVEYAAEAIRGICRGEPFGLLGWT